MSLKVVPSGTVYPLPHSPFAPLVVLSLYRPLKQNSRRMKKTLHSNGKMFLAKFQKLHSSESVITMYPKPNLQSVTVGGVYCVTARVTQKCRNIR